MMRSTHPTRRDRRRFLASGSAVGALALIAGLLVVPAANAVESEPPVVGNEAVVGADAPAPAEVAPEADDADAGVDSAEPGEAETAPESGSDASAEHATDTGATPAAEAKLSPLAIGDGTLSVLLTQTTGTEPFQDNDEAGNDSGPGNDIVRTNDSVTYTVGVRFEGSDHTNPTITFALPKGEELASLPPFCLPGSSVSPATLPAPVVPVTATSWESLPAQTVTCVIDDQAQGTSLDYRFISKVRPEVPNGTVLDAVTATAVSDEAEPATSEPVSHSVSAAANFDVSKRTDSTSDRNGPFYQYFGVCSFDESRPCVRMYFPLTMEGPAGGKGITPLASPITVTEDLRPDSFFGPGTTSSAAWVAAGEDALEKYAPRVTACANGAWHLWGLIPESRMGTVENSVRSSGTIACEQPELGTGVDLMFTGADTTGYTVPTLTSGGAPLPANSGYVLSTTLQIELPVDAIRDLGEAVDNTWSLNWENNFSKVDATAIDGSPNLGEDPENNVRAGSTKIESGFGFAKSFSGITGEPGNTSSSMFSGGWEYEGPPGSSTVRDGNTVVLPGQTVLSNVKVSQLVPPLTGTEYSRSFLGCDVWDSTKLGLPETFAFAGSDHTRVQLPSNGAPAWVSSVYLDEFQPDTSILDDLVIEYGYTDAPGNGEASACDSGEWASTPAGVSGASVVDGTWEGVNRVRFSFSSRAGSASPNFDVNFSIAMQVLDSAGDQGTMLPNWASLRSVPGVTDMDGIIENASASESLSSYNPDSNAGAFGDRLIVGQASARIKKYVKNPATGLFTDSAVPQYTAGSLVQYRLNPSLTATAAAAGLEQDVIIEDCLPKYQSFVGSQRESGAAIDPVLVASESPADAAITCAAGETYVKWDLGSNPIGAVIDPIVYSVEISATVRNGDYRNTAAVTSPGDPSPIAARTSSAQIQIVVPTGIKIAKTVDKPVVESNREDLENPRSLVWTIDFVNIDSPAQVSDVDVIDVLPANGVAGSSFSGRLVLDSATVSAGSGIEILYTSAAPASLVADPNDASNSATGATVWCDAATGGSVVSGAGTAADCPTSEADVTGLRFQRAGGFDPADELTVKVAMTPHGNAAGDVYENRASGRVNGVSQPVGPAVRTVNVIASSVGDRVWEDLNANGVQDAGEPGVAGFPVRLVGTDVDGNAVDLSTTTDENGAYLFDNLASGTYRVIFDPSGLNSNTTFTSQHSGDDPAIDSDADLVTGSTQEFTVGRDSDDLTLDAGLVIDRNVAIALDKQFLGATELDAENRTTVTYELTATNAGTAAGPYDLTDTLQFGGDIEIGEVTVENTGPGDIATNPSFDGQSDTTVVEGVELAGGASHTYLVTVEAGVSTTITREESECAITETETGSGFLNSAELSMNGETVTDKACGEPPVPPTTPETPGTPGDPDQPGKANHPVPGLPVTGGQLMLGTAGIAALLLAAGAATLVLVRRRRRESRAA